MNTTARLASAASADEILVTADTAAALELDTSRLERRTLGKQQLTEVVAVRVPPVGG